MTTLARETGGVAVIQERKDVDIEKVLKALGLPTS
jgi:hypothetical protein